MKQSIFSILFLLATSGSAFAQTTQVTQTSQATPIVMAPAVCAAPEVIAEPSIEANGICFQTLDDCNRQRLIFSDMERAGLTFSAKCDQALGAGVCEGNNFVLTTKVSVKSETMASQSSL